MKKSIFIALIAGIAGLASGQSFTDIDSAQYEGKTKFRKMAAAVDANFASVETLADAIGIASFAAVDNTNGTATVTIQVKDSAGTAIADRFIVKLWLAESAFAAPSTNNVESVTVDTGTSIQVITAQAYYDILTDTNGVVAVTLDTTADATDNIMASVCGIVDSAEYTSSGN